ncbi:NAC domain-containing protein [Besnoitia besnoiti]|uniref:Nascent polypeptide-associated complex subunit beta n=1 Tax=Besnoitia besnoiti TaxID=94643 RepID=A0A2A9M4V6_BESBE|nr:NAC domain-containing protein [Besnoitia besnoiti]PFH33518.1 NAC domain-containing protein [Besnoitia besnoiti]
MEEELTPQILAARAKLRERFGQASQQLGGKGTARRKTKKVHKSVVVDDKKLQLTLKRLGVSTIYGIEEVLMIQDNGKALQFLTPKVQASPAANTYVVSGHCEERPNMFPGGLPGMFSQRGAGGAGGMNFDTSLITPEMLRQLQQHMSALKTGAGEGAANGGADDAAETGGAKNKGEGDDDVPELVQNFEDVSKQ